MPPHCYADHGLASGNKRQQGGPALMQLPVTMSNAHALGTAHKGPCAQTSEPKNFYDRFASVMQTHRDPARQATYAAAASWAALGLDLDLVPATAIGRQNGQGQAHQIGQGNSSIVLYAFGTSKWQVLLAAAARSSLDCIATLTVLTCYRRPSWL